METIKDVLVKVDSLFSDESKWAKFEVALDPNGEYVNIRSENAVRFCLVGAVHRVTIRDDGLLCKVFDHLEKYLPHPFTTISSFNDDPFTNFEDIKTFLRRTISAVEK